MQRAGDRRADLWTGAGIVLAVAVAAVFLNRFVPARLLLIETARPAGAAVAVILACIGSGSLAIAGARAIFLRIAREPDDFEALSLLDALLIGFAVFGTVCGAIAWTGVAMPLLIVTVTAIAAAIGIVVLWRDRDALEWPASSASILVAAVPALLSFAQAVTPVNSPDELIYKLAIPHAYQLYGRMLELPLTAVSYLTIADQLASLPALILGGGIAARLMHFVIFIAALSAIHRLASRFGSVAAAATVGVMAWTPALMITAGWAWNDWSTLALLLIAFDRYERWVDTSTPSDAAVAFAALGSAAALKYTALPWIGALAIIVVARQRRTPRPLVAGALIALLFGAFFYIRNIVWTGSPFAPLFLPDAPAVANYRSGTSFGGWRDLIHGYDIFDPRIADESLGILLPVAALLGIGALFVRRERFLRDLVLISAIELPVVLSVAPGSRDAVNAFIPIAIAGSIVAAEAAMRGRSVLRAIIAATAIGALAAQLVLVLFTLSSYEIVPYLTGRESAAGYLQRTRAFARPFAWIARFTPPPARFLLLGENRTFYLQRQFISGGNLDGPRIAAWLARFATPAALQSDLEAKGVTHVLLHTPWYRAGGPPPGMLEKEYILQVTPAADAVLRAFLRTDAQLVYRDDEYLIFEIRRAPGGAGQPGPISDRAAPCRPTAGG